jgi:uncharacterized protein YjbI with pentapeptide repeats
VASPRAPYPPDADETTPLGDLADALDARIESGDFANARAVRSSLRRVELHLCRMTGAELAEATWIDVTLTDCRLDLAGFRHARLERVVFRDCRLDETDFSGSRLEDVHFERCSLVRASFASTKSERLRFSACDLSGLAGAESLRGAQLPWNDVLQNAPLFAQALGIDIVDDE